MSWADDHDDDPCAAVPPFQPTAAVAPTQPRPSLLAPSLPDRDSRNPRAAPVAVPHPRAPDTPKGKGHQGQRDDIARLQKNLSNASGPVSTLADRMGANPWSKPATPVGPHAAAAVTPRQLQAAPEPQRKPLVLAPRTQPLPVFPVAKQAPIPVPATVAPVAAPAAAPAVAISHTFTQKDDTPVTPKPSTPKSDPFGGAPQIDANKAAERRKQLMEEKAKLEASRLSDAKLLPEKPGKESHGDKEMPSRHQDERPSSARGGGWGGRGRSGECASSDTVETVDAPVSAGGARHGQGAHGAGGGGKGAKASTPRHDDIQHASSTAPVIRGHPHSPKLDAAAAADATGRAKGPPKSPNLGPAAASVVTAAAAAADGTPSNRGKGKRKESGGKGKPPQGTGDLPLPFDS